MFEKKPLRWFATPGLNTGPYPGFSRLWWKAAIFWTIVLALGFAASKYWEATQRKRVETDPHSTATIVSVWTEKHGRSGFEIKMGKITFVRQHEGKSVSCSITIYLENLPAKFQEVGQSIDIVPRAESCYRPIVPLLLGTS
ncbi:hypothetical protein FHS21_006343 [Phyllobacterium trifolii]|uniref:DUF3592 domain-containing protein n=1 Tax=Phyllobacterium trifolii TaxID=300193 RepID=A0A839UFS5_9HYPH|nr:hypothetical protein [Phyllobacterium trifolii]MBB3149886.1 hypothetical protein [Phyllobacterium trifolii]